MFVPHRREDAEFRETRGPAYQFQDAVIFIWLKAMSCDEFWCDFWFFGGRAGGQFINSRKIYRYFRLSERQDNLFLTSGRGVNVA